MADGLRIRIVLLFLGTCLAAFTACRKPAANSNQTPPVLPGAPQTNYRMPPAKVAPANLGWTIASEQHVRLSDYRNKVVVLDFYATWCEPCRESIPNLVELQKRYGSVGLEVIGLNVGGSNDLDKVPAFAREFHIQYQLGVPDAELAELYTGDDNAIPQTVVLDRQGRQLERFVGYDESVDQLLEDVIKKSLAVPAGTPSAQ